jgi:hypothetical protein
VVVAINCGEELAENARQIPNIVRWIDLFRKGIYLSALGNNACSIDPCISN